MVIEEQVPPIYAPFTHTKKKQVVNEEQVPPIYAPQGVMVEFGALDETVDADGRQVLNRALIEP